MASRSLAELDLYGAETLAEVERRIAGYAESHTGPWVVRRGWFYSAFPGGMPTIQLLDRLVPDRPAYLESFDAHTGWANTRALAVSGLASQGVLKEAAMSGVTRHIPARSRAEDQEALREGMLADLAVLDRDIRATPASELHSMNVAATIVGGRVVYER